MSVNYTDAREMSGISLKVTEMSGKKSRHGKLTKNFHNCANRLFSSTHLVLYANYSNLCLCYIMVAVDGTGFYDVIITKSLSVNMNLTV